MHIETLSYAATQPNTGLAATALTGDSLVVKNGRGSKIEIIAAWATQQVAGFHQIAFPSGHDTTRGYRVDTYLGQTVSVLPLGQTMEVQGQEALSVTIAGSNVAGDVEQGTLLMHYDDLPGVSQRLITESQLNSRAEKLTTIQQAVVSAAGPGYSGSALITAGSDLLMANRDYALLGAITRTPVHQVTIVGPDTGNVKIGIPGISSRSDFGGQFFPMLNRITGKPTIPIISSGNKSSTFIGVSTDENAGTFNVTLMLALLK